jgi:cephalosporin hydroxylase
MWCQFTNLLFFHDGPRPPDIEDHLPALFWECVAANPKLIVELGTREGVATKALTSAAALSDAHVVSVDIDNCASVSDYPKWQFVQADDVAFASEFPSWCSERGINPSVDFLFIDTSHHYFHTVQEIGAWFPRLSPRCRVVFHDTNLREILRTKNGQRLTGWDNERGVIRAIEEHFEISINETRQALIYVENWRITHLPYCFGLTILERH